METKIFVSIPFVLRAELESASRAILATLGINPSVVLSSSPVDEAVVPQRVKKTVRFIQDTPRDHDTDPPHRAMNGKRQRTSGPSSVPELSPEELASLPVIQCTQTIGRGRTIRRGGMPVDTSEMEMDPDVFFKNLLDCVLVKHNVLEDRTRLARELNGGSSSSDPAPAPLSASSVAAAAPAPLSASSVAAAAPAPLMFASSSEDCLPPPTSRDDDGEINWSAFDNDI
jgi:hypothetical protein